MSPPFTSSALIFLYRLSGAVIKGYERDVGTRTSFYGFTAFSLVQSILILGRRGFQHVPLGKVRSKEWAWPHSPLTGEIKECEWAWPHNTYTGESYEWLLCAWNLAHPKPWSQGARAVTTAAQAMGEPGSRVRRGPPSAQAPQGSTGPLPLAVLGLQDVRYLHFLEGARDYEWLEAMFLNQTLAKTKLYWFRYPLPSSCPGKRNE